MTERAERYKKVLAKISTFAKCIEDGKRYTFVSKSPKFVQFAKMRDYQVEALNWLISLYVYQIEGGILADEMGLGKTLEIIAFLGYLKYKNLAKGPHLVLVPKTTRDNWRKEFEQWCPQLNIYLTNDADDRLKRRRNIRKRLEALDFDVFLVTFDMCVRDKDLLQKPNWHCLILDEGHRIKNFNTRAFQILKLFSTRFRLIATGTPIQNNLTELWSLLNMVLPEIFEYTEDFDEWFGFENCLKNDETIGNLQNILQPIMLRRTKKMVLKDMPDKTEINIFVKLYPLQRDLYLRTLTGKLHELCCYMKTYKNYNNNPNFMLLQLRKICNHPYMYRGVEPGPPYVMGDHVLTTSGKMFMLDKMLAALHKQGKRVLLFCQFKRMLDIIEDYLVWKKYTYLRLDGSCSNKMRAQSIEEFNRKGSNIFIFILCTRAGGLGINLQTADTVIFYDFDWNPQVDIQAMDRAHRIGQKNHVRVYRLITENAVDEQIVECAKTKAILNLRLLGSNCATSMINYREIYNLCVDDFMNTTNKEVFFETEINIEDILLHGRQKSALNIINNNNNMNSINKNTNQNNLNNNNNILRRKRTDPMDFRFYSEELKQLLQNSKRRRAITRTEHSKLNALLRESFSDWTEQDFQSFILALEMFGTNNMSSICSAVAGKTPEEVKAYYDVFWQRCHELRDHEEILARIPGAEKKKIM